MVGSDTCAVWTGDALYVQKTTRLTRKYFYEQDVENDKHSSWLLNRSEAVCGLQGMFQRGDVVLGGSAGS